MSGIFTRKRSSLLTPERSRFSVIQRKHSFLLNDLKSSSSSRTKKFNGDSKLGSSRFQSSTNNTHRRSSLNSAPVNAQAKYQQSTVKTQVKRKPENKQDVHGKKTVITSTTIKANLTSACNVTELLQIDLDLKIIENRIADLKNEKQTADNFAGSIRCTSPVLGRIEENPPMADGPDSPTQSPLPIVGSLEINIAMIQNELKDLKCICMENKQISEYLHRSYQDVKEEIKSQNSNLAQLGQRSLSPHAPSRHQEPPSIKTTDNEIRGIILNLSIIIGLFLYHFLFLLNESKWTE